MPAQDPNELLPVVDGDDRELGLAKRSQIHAKKLLHRAVHVLVFDDQGRLWLQRRSQAKDSHPGKWTSSASGHVDPDESYQAAAVRELDEELGLSPPLTFLGKLAASELTEGEFSAVYRARSSQQPRPNHEEIAEMGRFSLEEAKALAADLERSAPGLAGVLELLSGAGPANSGKTRP
jgi:isopentenyl-diphosphate Delta-isomerase